MDNSDRKIDNSFPCARFERIDASHAGDKTRQVRYRYIVSCIAFLSEYHVSRAVALLACKI